MALDITALVAEFGSYYQEQANMDRLKSQLRQGGEIMNLCKRISTKNKTHTIALVGKARKVQPWKSDWSPTDGGDMNPHTIIKHRMKVDEELQPDDHTLDTYLTFLEGEGIDRSEWPFIRWYIEKEMLPQIIEDLELNELWLGEQATPAAGATPGAISTSIDGLALAIVSGLSAGYVNAINTGALDATDSVFVEQMEDWAQAVPALYRNKKLVVHMSYANALRFQRGYEDLYGTIANPIMANAAGGMNLRYTNWNIVGLVGMGSSDRVWATNSGPGGNIILLQNRIENMNNFKVEVAKRMVNIMTDFDLGIGFEDPRDVFVNDQA
jgi:hypothetical protein